MHVEVNFSERKLSFQEPYDATKSAEDPDEWLRDKLNALKHKRLHDPDGQQRRQAERLLLEVRFLITSICTCSFSSLVCFTGIPTNDVK